MCCAKDEDEEGERENLLDMINVGELMKEKCHNKECPFKKLCNKSLESLSRHIIWQEMEISLNFFLSDKEYPIDEKIYLATFSDSDLTELINLTRKMRGEEQCFGIG